MATQLLKNMKTKRSTALRRTQPSLLAPSKSCAILVNNVCKRQRAEFSQICVTQTYVKKKACYTVTTTVVTLKQEMQHLHWSHPLTVYENWSESEMKSF